MRPITARRDGSHKLCVPVIERAGPVHLVLHAGVGAITPRLPEKDSRPQPSARGPIVGTLRVELS